MNAADTIVEEPEGAHHGLVSQPSEPPLMFPTGDQHGWSDIDKAFAMEDDPEMPADRFLGYKSKKEKKREKKAAKAALNFQPHLCKKKAKSQNQCK